MEIKASYFAAFFVLLYFGIGIFVAYFFRKRFSGRFGGQGYKFPAIIYFVSVPIIVAIGTDFFSNYDGDAIYKLSPSLDSQFAIFIFIFAIIPTIIYLGIGLYILSLEHIKGKKGYKGPAIIYFISVPTLILIAITIQFMMNYSTGRFESNNKPVGYEIYKFLVLQDIIPRSGLTLDDKSSQQDLTITQSGKIQAKINQVSVADKNEFEAIIENLSIGESLSYDLSNKNDEEKITATIEKHETSLKNVNDKEITFVSTKYNYEVLDKSRNKISYHIRTNDKYPKYKTYTQSIGDTFYAYAENVDEYFKGYKIFGNSNFYFMFSNQFYEENDLYIGLKKSYAEIALALEPLKIKIDNKVLTEEEAEKIALDIIISHINYVNFTDNTLIYSLPSEERENFSSFPRKGKYEENSILHYERQNKINVENSDFKGLCNNQEKFNNFYINNYEKKDCKELLYSLLEDKLKTDFVSKSKELNKKLISYLNSPLGEKLKTDEKYYALVIGNNNYEHLEKLDAAENDALVIADLLKNKYGFEVDLLLNADQETTVDTLFSITDKLKQNDNLLIYYAGHGELDKAENRGYWLPVDASYEKRSKWISNQTIVDRIKATKAKHVLLVADSCFSGTLMRSGTNLQNQEPIDEKYIERLKNKKTRLVITSGGNEPVVDSVGGDHSLFALKFIDTLKNSENVINSQILFENIRRYVVANADQTPERAMVHKTGHDGGDFLFFPK